MRVSGARVQGLETPLLQCDSPPPRLWECARYRARGTPKLGYPPRSISEDRIHKYRCALFLLLLFASFQAGWFILVFSPTRIKDPLKWGKLLFLWITQETLYYPTGAGIEIRILLEPISLKPQFSRLLFSLASIRGCARSRVWLGKRSSVFREKTATRCFFFFQTSSRKKKKTNCFLKKPLWDFLVAKFQLSVA